MKTKNLLFAGIFFIGVGLLVGLPSVKRIKQTTNGYTPSVLGVSELNNTPNEYVGGKPVHIEIPSIDISLDIIDGKYTKSTKSWTLSSNNAQFAIISSEANNTQGNTFIYGHNNRKVFAKLDQINIGDKAIVTTENSIKFVYTYSRSQITSPEDTSIFTYEGPPILTLQTCSGAWYENRSLFSFDFSEIL